MTTLLWLSQDLRFDDNPALNAAISYNQPVLPWYWDDPSNPALHTGAGRWWLTHSLKAFNDSLRATGGVLACSNHDFDGFTQRILAYQCKAIVFSASAEPHLAQQQRRLYEWATEQGIACRRLGGLSMTQHDLIKTKAGGPYKVFTPYYRACLQHIESPAATVNLSDAAWQQVDLGDGFERSHLQPWHPQWAKGFSARWRPGEQGALEVLNTATPCLDRYSERRDFPSEDMTSQLSAHLHFGEISPRRIWQHVQQHWPQGEAEAFLRQLIWRDFSRYLLHHFPHIVAKPFNTKFSGFSWLPNATYLKRWQTGTTGYPIVDAGMRQLWQTGWMHNRVRMIVASFLTKHLRIHWCDGAAWFWDTLVDADLANNIAGWQWVAGCGADAAPYFRIFNPITQGQKFDAQGEYIRQYVPELAALPNKYIHSPWLASEVILGEAGVTLGQSYPQPIVDHAQARQIALAAYADLSK